MAVDVTAFMADPWGMTFSCFVDLLGTPFYLIPLSVIAGALYIKTKDVAIVSMYLISSSALLLSAGMFTGLTDMVNLYVVIIAIGLGGLVVELFLRR